MKVFFCWSGERSKVLAEAFADWLQQVIQAIEPWISTGMEKGIRWQQEIAQQLEGLKAGIVCLTPENLSSTWIHFEAGALAKTKDAHLYTFLFGLQPANLKEPLSWFTATKAEEKDIRKLIYDLNNLLGEIGERFLPEKALDEIFNLNWPRFRNVLQGMSAKPQQQAPVPDQKEMIQETLETVRQLREFLRVQRDEQLQQRQEIKKLTDISTIAVPSQAIYSLPPTSKLETITAKSFMPPGLGLVNPQAIARRPRRTLRRPPEDPKK